MRARLLAAAVLGLLPLTGRAGLNGQQISFRTPGAGFDWVRISGDNQNDRAVTWDSSRFGLICNAGRCAEARTRNWWFKGKVTIEYQFRGEPTTYSCHFYVNEQQPDFNWVNLLAPQRLVSLNRSSDGATGTEVRCEPRPPGGTDAAVPSLRRFDSRADALAAGCLFGHVKGPDIDTCVLGTYAGSSLNLNVYVRSQGNAYAVANELAIPSQYHDSNLSLADMLGQGADWMVIETTGMHGTGIGQRVLFVLAWDGAKFRTVAAETLDYHCAKPTSPADYALQVQHEFKPLGRAPGLVLDYELTKEGALIGKWSQQLRWSDYEQRFMPYQSKMDLQTDPVVHHLLAQLEHVRVYSASGPMDPAGDAARWMGRSELMDVMGPACSPSLLYLARDFSGKWLLDHERTGLADDDAPSPVKAPVLGADREALHFRWRADRADGTYEFREDIYRFDGKAFPLTARLTGGREVQGSAVAVMDGEKMVVTIRVEGWSQPLRRIFYRDGYSLVVEETGGPSGIRTVAYYEKA